MTEFNSHFIQRYGSTIFVDATYNIDCENSILSVGAVLTNYGYEPVMMSIVPNGTSDTIQTALQHLKYRTGLSPKFITPYTMDGIFRDPAAHISLSC